MSRLPSSVLYVCSMNRVRSPMAAALTRRLYGEAIQAASSGLQLADEVDPMALAVMAEVGTALSGHRPRPLGPIAAGDFDLIVALSPDAWERVRRLPQDQFELEYWPTQDPTVEEGSREQRLEAYRQTRRDLETRITGRFGPPPEWE